MSALVLSRADGHSALASAELPVPEPLPGFVRVRVEACGLNPVDVGLSWRGDPAWTYPHVLGLDGAGTVDAVGAAVTAFGVGDRVTWHGDLRRPGALADYALVDARALAIIPEGVDATAAAALPCAGMTAYQAVVRRLRVEAGQTVLVTAGNGGVGGFAIQLAARAGARVIATASGGFEGMLRLGAEATVDYRESDALDRIRAAAGDPGIDAIVDTVSAASATRNLALLNHAGGIACVAGRADLSEFPRFAVSPSVHEISLGAAYSTGLDKHLRDLGAMLTELLALVESGDLDPRISRVVSLEGVPAALENIATRHTVGKIVVAWPPKENA